MHDRLLIDGKWVQTESRKPVTNKYTSQVLAEVSQAGDADAASAVAAAERAAVIMAKMPSHQRSALLAKAASLIEDRGDEFARLIAAEAGKAMKFARVEVQRCVETFTFAAEEAKRIHGETVPLDASKAGEGYFGFWQRKPMGVVLAITPFNFPLNLVAHKLAPAFASGNAVVLKPAGLTPLTAGLLCDTLMQAGLPDGAINLIHGPGKTVGQTLAADSRIAKITFTGSPPTARKIIATAGIKRVTLELGNTGPVIVADDADLDLVARKCALGAFYYSGQVCISVQRIYATPHTLNDLTDRFIAATGDLVVGDPLDDQTDVGPMIQEEEAQRIEQWVSEAKAGGARVLTGDRREGPVYWPTILTDVNPSMKVVRDEAFGPIASVMPYDNFEQALAYANQTDYGLQASVFTQDIDRVLSAIDHLNFGGVIINDTPNFRVDHMPYGGNRMSGVGREGVRYAMEEMTNVQMVAIRRKS